MLCLERFGRNLSIERPQTQDKVESTFREPSFRDLPVSYDMLLNMLSAVPCSAHRCDSLITDIGKRCVFMVPPPDRENCEDEAGCPFE